jgi:hypothetical protein
MRIVIGGLALAALLLVATGPARAQDLVVNGGFESGNFAGWTQGGNTGNTGVGTADDGALVHSGQYAAFLGPVNSHGTLSQVLPTDAGTTYTLTYWLANDGGTPSFFSAALNGAMLAGSILNDPDAFGYRAFSFDFTAAGSTTLQFEFQENPAFFYLDDVSVTPFSPVPEPAGLTLFGLGLVPLAGYAWRRRQKAAG